MEANSTQSQEMNHARVLPDERTQECAATDGSLPKVDWRRPGTRKEGISYGYGRLIEEGDKAVEPDETSRVAFHITPVEKFEPVEGKKNVLLTMWESEDFPAGDVDIMNRADALIVPCKWNVETFGKRTDVPIYHVPLGVNTKEFPYKRRKKPTNDDPFVWFWTASPDPRKGWGLVAKMWERYFGHRSDCLLYMKTSAQGKSEVQAVGNNIIWDCRLLSPDHFTALYHMSHAFLFSSYAEGFGFTAAEAMSTGLPVVGMSYGGQADFLNEHTAYTVPYVLHRVDAIRRQSEAPDGKYSISVPYGENMAEQMSRVMKEYSEATRKAENAARLIHTYYTWDLFRKGVGDVLRKYLSEV